MAEKDEKNITSLRKYSKKSKLLGSYLQRRKMFTKTIHAKHGC